MRMDQIQNNNTMKRGVMENSRNYITSATKNRLASPQLEQIQEERKLSGLRSNTQISMRQKMENSITNMGTRIDTKA